MELIVRPRRDLVRWARFTKQTPNIRIGYPGQHLASLVTGVEGARTGARGHDLCDGSEVKSCSRIDQLDKCLECRAAVARLESTCPQCSSRNIKRNDDSKWLFTVRSEEELRTLLGVVPRIVLIIGDYPRFAQQDWDTLRFQVFEIWPQHPRHARFCDLMNSYYHNIYVPHIEKNPNKTPAPKNFWPYSFQFYLCNPVRIFHATVTGALDRASIHVKDYIDPDTDRSSLNPVPMPLSILNDREKRTLRQSLGVRGYAEAATNGLDESQRSELELRATDRASPQNRSYQRGVR